MTKQTKLQKRFLTKPKDFTWTELTTLLSGLGYQQINLGKTSGSRVKFIHPRQPSVFLHRPNPKPTLKTYQIRYILEILEKLL